MAVSEREAPRPPAGLRKTGRTLWRAVLCDYELTEPERVLLLQAARTADLLDDLQARLEAEGIMAESSQGIRVHPCAAELRQQRIALARLWAALRVPMGEDVVQAGRTQLRGIRGVYSGGVA